MYRPNTIPDPERDLFDFAERRHYGVAGLGFLIATFAFALTIWTLSSGIAALGSVEDGPVSSETNAPRVTIVVPAPASRN